MVKICVKLQMMGGSQWTIRVREEQKIQCHWTLGGLDFLKNCGFTDSGTLHHCEHVEQHFMERMEATVLVSVAFSSE